MVIRELNVVFVHWNRYCLVGFSFIFIQILVVIQRFDLKIFCFFICVNTNSICRLKYKIINSLNSKLLYIDNVVAFGFRALLNFDHMTNRI